MDKIDGFKVVIMTKYTTKMGQSDKFDAKDRQKRKIS